MFEILTKRLLTMSLVLNTRALFYKDTGILEHASVCWNWDAEVSYTRHLVKIDGWYAECPVTRASQLSYMRKWLSTETIDISFSSMRRF